MVVHETSFGAQVLIVHLEQQVNDPKEQSKAIAEWQEKNKCAFLRGPVRAQT